MPIGAVRSLTQVRRFFRRPASPRQRQYEALRAFYIDEIPSAEVAERFGYTPGSFRVLCHEFRHDPDPQFFLTPRTGPRSSSAKASTVDRIVALRKKNHSIYEISELLEGEKIAFSPGAVGKVLRDEGFAP